MNEQFRRLSAVLARLSPREQRLVGIFAAWFAAVLCYNLIIEPLAGGRRRLESEITSLRRDIGTMATLASRISVAESGKAGRTAKRSALSKDFSLFSFVDKVTAASLRPESVASMNPSRRELDDGSVESIVELKLSQVSLAEVVAMLRGMQEAAQPVFVKRFDMKKRYDDRNRFDIVVVTAALSRT